MNWMDYIPALPRLSEGSHDEESGSRCAMEMVAFLERLPHSDSPPCTCPVIASFVRVINDNMDDESRQMLLPYLPRLVDTVSPEHEQARAEAIALHAVNHIVPSVMEGIIPASLVEAMRSAETLDAGVYAAANAARAAAGAASGRRGVERLNVCAARAAAQEAHGAAVAARAAGLSSAGLSAGLSASHASACALEIWPLSAARADFFDGTGAAEIWSLALEGLERMLAIGPQGRTTFDKERVEELIHTA